MDAQRMKDFRARMKAGPVIGPFAKSSDPGFVEIVGWSGFDFIILDLEHGPGTVLNLQNLIRAAEVAGVFPFVRTKEDNLSIIGEVLDVGAGGVVVPQVTSAREAAAVIERAKFAPQGHRGVCRFVRAARYSATDRYEYFAGANEALVVLQLEGREAVENLEEILRVKGADVLFVGPYDLSQSLGVAGQIDHPKVIEKMTHIVKRCAEKGMAAGLFSDTPAAARRWMDLGARFVSYSVDVGLFYDKCRSVVQELRAT